MISTKKLIKLARKWQIMAAIREKRITSARRPLEVDVNAKSCSTSSSGPIVEKGHFVVYVADQRRFVLPLEYLKNKIVAELFALAEEEFGLPGDGPLTLPFDAAFIEYVIVFIKLHATEDVQTFLMSVTGTGRSISSSSSSSSNLIEQTSQRQQLICSF